MNWGVEVIKTIPMKNHYLTLFILIFISIFQSKACTCEGSNEIKNISDLEGASFIARVKVKKLKLIYIAKSGDLNDRSFQLVEIETLELFKGKKQTKFFDNSIFSSLAMDFVVGEEWLIVSFLKNGKHYVDGYCGYSEKIKNEKGEKINKYYTYLLESNLDKVRRFYGKEMPKPQDGVLRTYYANGQLEVEEYFEAGKLNGFRKFWYANGQVQGIQFYKNGKLHGNSMKFFPNGRVEIDENFFDGHQIGERFIYSEHHPDPFEEKKSHRKPNEYYLSDQQTFDANGKFIRWRRYDFYNKIWREGF